MKVLVNVYIRAPNRTTQSRKLFRGPIVPTIHYVTSSNVTVNKTHTI